MKAFKAFIKPSEAPQRSVKIKIEVNFLSLSTIGTGRVNSYKMKLKQNEHNRIYHFINSQKSKNLLLSHFRPIIIFHHPSEKKRLKVRYFPMFSGGIEREHCHEMSLPFGGRCPLKCHTYLNKLAVEYV